MIETISADPKLEWIQKRKKEKEKHTSIYTSDPGPNSQRFLGLDLVLIRRIGHLGWPVIIGMVSQTAINTVDMLFIGRLPSEIAVPGTAAILSSIILLWAFGGFLAAVGIGTQAITARRFSEGELSKAGQVLTNALLISLIASVFVTLFSLYTLEPLMSFLSSDPSVQKAGISYCTIRYWGLFSMALTAAFKSFYDGMGRVRIHMTVALCMNLVNAVMCYFLVFGFSFLGFQVEPLYIEGAAISALASSVFGLILMFAWTLKRREQETFKIYSLKNLNFDVAYKISKLSIWSGLATIIIMVGVGIFNHIISYIDQVENTGAINSSAASIVIHVMMLIFMSCLAFGTSTATLVAQSVGAKKPDLAMRYGLQSVLLAVYLISIFGFIAFLFPETILRFFMPEEITKAGVLKDLVVERAIPSLRLAVALLAPLAGTGLVLTQALYGAGNTRFVMIVEFILHFGCLVPLAWLFGIYLEMGLIGCWIASIVYGALLFLLTGAQFARGKWKKNQL